MTMIVRTRFDSREREGERERGREGERERENKRKRGGGIGNLVYTVQALPASSYGAASFVSPGSMPQISRAYSEIVRSVENLPEFTRF